MVGGSKLNEKVGQNYLTINTVFHFSGHEKLQTVQQAKAHNQKSGVA
jgi:hypothetical protein